LIMMRIIEDLTSFNTIKTMTQLDRSAFVTDYLLINNLY